MAAQHDATLNLSSLIKDAVEIGGEVEGQGLLMPPDEVLAQDGLHLADPLTWQLTVRSTGGDDDYVLIGSVSGNALMECRRCLTDVTTPVATRFIYPMAYRPGTKPLHLEENDDGADVLVFGRPEVDFTELLTQLFAIDLPLTALCKETCRGLSVDGVNLNEHPELASALENDHSTNSSKDGTQDNQAESPFAVLKDFHLK